MATDFQIENLYQVYQDLITLQVKLINGTATEQQYKSIDIPNPIIEWDNLEKVLSNLKIEMFWEGHGINCFAYNGATLKQALTEKLPDGFDIAKWRHECWSYTWKNIGIAIRNDLISLAVSCQKGEVEFVSGVPLSYIAEFKARRITGWE